MKRVLILIPAILALNAFAYSQEKIGVINAQQIIEKSKRGVRIQQKLENLQKSKQGQLQSQQDEIERLEKEVLSPALNEETRGKKSAELQAKRTQLKRSYEDAQREFERESQKELASLEKELMPLIQDYGRAGGFTVILDITRPGIVYFDDAIDITSDLIREIDARFP